MDEFSKGERDAIYRGILKGRGEGVEYREEYIK